MILPFLVALVTIFIIKITFSSPGPCVVVICNNRPDLLKTTLESLLSANGVQPDDVYVSQNGASGPVFKVANDTGIRNHWVNMGDRRDSKAQRLARHFNWTFANLFEQTSCPGVIVIEDDLKLSPDFMDYFKMVIPIVNADPTLLTASLWNDLGLEDNTHDMRNLKRVNFFPGLGWYLSRDTWYELLGPEWPSHDWDWYVRDVAARKKLDTIIPEISRDYHVAKTGTYMTSSFFKQYFQNIRMAEDRSFKWESRDARHVATPSAYRDHINQLVADGGEVRWVDGFGEIRDKNVVRRACSDFLKDTGLWAGELERGEWDGIHVLWSKSRERYIYMADVNKAHWLNAPKDHVSSGLEICA